ncbi:hypothetical protein QVD17_31814 [Tagetes erecta]|uniref:Uncharacterized protein n=1 Tax=Tagetes erecta TaxID=13708 RepID=A0AAD8NPL3_TARER|nr:hypothetical protein QVD17_31814 [Tagetes erecta]
MIQNRCFYLTLTLVRLDKLITSKSQNAKNTPRKIRTTIHHLYFIFCSSIALIYRSVKSITILLINPFSLSKSVQIRSSYLIIYELIHMFRFEKQKIRKNEFD